MEIPLQTQSVNRSQRVAIGALAEGRLRPSLTSAAKCKVCSTGNLNWCDETRAIIDQRVAEAAQEVLDRLNYESCNP